MEVVVSSIGVNVKVLVVVALHRKLRVEMTVVVLVVTIGSLCRAIAATNHVVVHHNAGAKCPYCGSYQPFWIDGV